MRGETRVAAEPAERSRLRRVAHWSWPAHFPIVQLPNAPLAVALLASLAAGLTEGTAHRSLRAVFYLSLGVWAYEEARRGDNWFRRALGLGFSIYLIVSLASALGSQPGV
jgi:hypothetical protein